jgi:lipoyl(octanoyl) transferase
MFRNGARAAQKLGNFDRDAVAVHHHLALGDGLIIGEDFDFVIFAGIEFDHGTAAHAQQLMDGHAAAAQHHGNIKTNRFERCHLMKPPGLPFGRYCDYVMRLNDGYGQRLVKTRDEIDVSFWRSDARPPEWRVEPGLLPYEAAISAMEARAAAISSREAGERIWLVEHPPLYTAGTSANESDLIEQRFPVFKTGRGGEHTYHGPGQRVVYTMLDLASRHQDVRAFVAALERWIIAALAEFSIIGERREDRVGVWVKRPDKGPGCEDKIAAIGIRVRRWVTFHGISLNVEPDLGHFSGIVPCGIRDPRFGVTSLVDLGLPVGLDEADAALKTTFASVFGGTEP